MYQQSTTFTVALHPYQEINRRKEKRGAQNEFSGRVCVLDSGQPTFFTSRRIHSKRQTGGEEKRGAVM
jgi:hypothetical protein